MSTVCLIDAEQAPLLARPFYANGDPGPIVASLAQVPELLEVALPFIGAALGPSAISWRAKELVIVRTSALLECRYCVQTHTAVALDAGLTRDEILALRGEAPVGSAFPEPREAALLAWVDAVAGERGAVADTTTAALHEHRDDHEVVELTMLVGATMMLNRFATALRLPTSADTVHRLTEEDLL
ncbi:carboxymuconolactone decarboxylase family protein [Actinophytocola sp.]|uniref:carboxymuconolactone decarboxylase family protein n=1 Tax=Actinophytocola sp. TaxID=1872138 RepID=UPI003D6C3E3B